MDNILTKQPATFLQKVTYMSTDLLVPYTNNARTHSDKQIEQIANSIQRFGFNNPILVDHNNVVIAGHGRLLAAKKIGLDKVPTLKLEHMSEKDKKAYILADNKLAENAGWDNQILKLELEGLIEFDTDFDLTITGFSTPEIDLIFHDDNNPKPQEIEALSEDIDIPARVEQGDLWQLGNHYLYCGDSLLDESYKILLGDKKANMVFTDPPYNVRVDGHVGGKGKIKHDEFAFASGEMSTNEFIDFLETSFKHLKDYSTNGSLHFVCMDWRHSYEILQASQKHYAECKNICVWNKQIGGMGSLYRSQHEFIYVFKNGTKPHINNIELGKHGRNRTNIWDYPGAGACSVHRNDLKFHPTVKPVSLIADAIRDCSKQGHIILDNFAGSGSTLLAAEKTKRKAYLIEYEPKYCDVILWRYEQETGLKANKINQQEG